MNPSLYGLRWAVDVIPHVLSKVGVPTQPRWGVKHGLKMEKEQEEEEVEEEKTNDDPAQTLTLSRSGFVQHLK